MSTKEIAEKLFNKNWCISFDDTKITLTHSRPTTVITHIEIDTEKNTVEAVLANEVVSINRIVKSPKQAAEAIEETLALAITKHQIFCRRLERAICDIQEE